MPMTDPGAFAHTAKGVGLAEDLARATMTHVVEMTNVARLDTTITSLFLIVEALAALQVHAGLPPADALAEIEHLTSHRVAELQAAEEAEQAGEPAEQEHTRPSGGLVLYAAGTSSLH